MKDDPKIQPYIEKVSVGELSETERKEMLQIVRKSAAIKQAMHISELYLKKALKEIEGLPNHPMKKKLRDIALFIGKRKF